MPINDLKKKFEISPQAAQAIGAPARSNSSKQAEHQTEHLELDTSKNRRDRKDLNAQATPNQQHTKKLETEVNNGGNKSKAQAHTPDLVMKKESSVTPNTRKSPNEKIKAEDIFHRYKDRFSPSDRELPFEIMNEITNNGIAFSSEKAPESHLDKVKDKKFTLRHYTSGNGQEKPTFNEIGSNFNLVNEGIKTLKRTQGSNTNEDDWNRLGNTAFTFFLLAIDGEVSDRKFLSNTTHFAEIDIENPAELKELGLDETEFFASPDLLHEKNLSQAPAVKGKLSDLKSLLLKQSGIKPVQLQSLGAKGILERIDSKFNGSLEIKIPGNVKVKEWKKVEK
ncbi:MULTISPECIES: hypothetical protein [Photorhabdus]|uniref:Photorhabdus luminescens subsp. laumondii TTO1 complete genome segment 6/17 n=1 Tax=Photorhabdus laumondii subsp. laumondii (strain DSM 15139 / CIP 105565 / TT01) TaxID=243265 RepID=Q7N690_PHOLL|nr:MULTISPECIES: hypothetical protein [Photorhabdus]AWK41515.1 hypothetical protein A4R40_08440 [Photorhabdus laumondii subsp. laumondii]KTL61404.1 hypothetical protein AA106_08770 [Photorhabdus laumondii subsp. laumondii]MCC8382139.1 hypothetical protein [Photorhabdus laumondii]MCC8387414.1 hypothetical protein [Photorhabdus laumondii]MCC8411946.1 hypothetical protein [Photorhabdus laumondii]